VPHGPVAWASERSPLGTPAQRRLPCSCDFSRCLAQKDLLQKLLLPDLKRARALQPADAWQRRSGSARGHLSQANMVFSHLAKWKPLVLPAVFSCLGCLLWPNQSAFSIALSCLPSFTARLCTIFL